MTNLGSFTAFIHLLRDQSMPGGGQTNVLKGAHHAQRTFSAGNIARKTVE